MSRLWTWWDRYEGPTWVLAVVIYSSWIALTLSHARMAWWVLLAAGAIVTAWHASLQHETIHALGKVPRPLRTLLAGPPLGLGFPYALYVRDHRRHHRTARLTDPIDDPETFYHTPPAWRQYHPALRTLLLWNQTVLGRLTIGAPLRLWTLGAVEIARLRAGDRSNLRIWLWHAWWVGVVLTWVCAVARMPWWQYLVLFALPGMCLGMLRSFIEHRAGDDADHRTAIVENDVPFGILFLYNNLHAVHHAAPALPWYKIRAVWRSQRAEILARNGNFYMSGYRAVFRRWLIRPVFEPVQALTAIPHDLP